MKYLFALLILSLFVFRDGALNVRDFGATGDGRTDDAAAVNRALRAAHLQGKDLYFPQGTYLCNTVDADKHILVFEASGVNGTHLYGDGKSSKITTSLNAESILLYVYAYAGADSLSIRNLFFENTHQLIPYTTQGVFIQGTKAQNLSHVSMEVCRFEGFSTAIGGQGVNGWAITNDTFGSPRGHDCAKNDAEPAVYTWFADNANGYCTDIRITGNLADGYTGTNDVNTLVTRRGMDGFVFGTGYGFTITGNSTQNFSEEHYNLSPVVTFPKDSRKNLISNNYIRANIPLGSMDSNGQKHVVNYGIRCDISNAVISQNEIREYTYGIMLRGMEYPDVTLHSYQIYGNKLYSADDTANYDVQSAIFVQGNLKNRVSDIRITNNDIYINRVRHPASSEGIVLFDMDKGVIQDNNIHLNADTSQTIGRISYGRTSNLRLGPNKIVGTKFHSAGTPTGNVQINPTTKIKDK